MLLIADVEASFPTFGRLELSEPPVGTAVGDGLVSPLYIGAQYSIKVTLCTKEGAPYTRNLPPFVKVATLNGIACVLDVTLG